MAGRERQKNRFQRKTISCNAQMRPRLLKKNGVLDSDSYRLWELAMEYLGLNAPAYHRILTISRTIADLENSEAIAPDRISEASQYQNLDHRLY